MGLLAPEPSNQHRRGASVKLMSLQLDLCTADQMAVTPTSQGTFATACFQNICSERLEFNIFFF